MKRFAEGFCTAFSLYSILPAPPAKWDRDSMRYALCFFPVVGLFIMGAALLWQYLAYRWVLAPGLFAAVATLLPLGISGGIHMDGFLDTVDAVSSHASQEKKLEILADPHIGAFGVLGCGVYLLLSCGLWTQVYQSPRMAALPAAGYVISRALNGWGIAWIPCAKTSGLVYLFSGGTSRRAVTLTCGGFVAAGMVFLLWVSPLWGGVTSVLCLLCYLRHRRWVEREFGGNTGDLSGYLTQKLELLVLLAAAIGGIAS